MEKNEKSLFVILEDHLEQRYKYTIEKYGFMSYKVGGFKNIQLGNSTKSILNRILQRSIVNQESEKLINFISDSLNTHELESIYFSSSEGYIAHNLITRVKKKFPKLELIGLQHGIFEFSLAPKSYFRKAINIFFKTVTGIYPIGVGFGGKIVDKYIVYNQIYKDFLIKKFDWKENDVEINLEFLKAELLDKKISIKKNGCIALFLMQGLSLAQFCTKKQEDYLNEKVVEYLISKYETVYIKPHPGSSLNAEFERKYKSLIINDLIDAFNLSTHAYSYSSTALFDAELFELEVFAINSNLVKEDKSIYRIFKNVIDFEKELNLF